MFTVKYRTYNLARTQPVEGPRHYDEVEMIYGPFELISKEQDDDGYTVVHCHRAGGAPALTVKHCDHENEDMRPKGAPPTPRSTAWIMNEQGATIAKYDL